MFNNTVKQLAAITDAAQFERIATAVLRAAEPALFGNLSHQGVNTDGKTVKAPLDNIGWAHKNGEPICVAAAHTTSSRDDLEGKWLHDPSTAKSRVSGRKPSQQTGDLIKAISEIAKLRVAQPGLKATLVLTTNREEPTEVRLKAQALADAANITLDIWSVSRIAQYLDTTPDGQAIRHSYLGTHVRLLSIEVLIAIGKRSLEVRELPIDSTNVIARPDHIGRSGHVFFSGTSGMGKTTICMELLRKGLEEGQPGIVLSDETVRKAISIEEAIDIELRRYFPELEPLAGVRALALAAEAKPMIVLIEDINRAVDTVNLLNKLASWTLKSMVGSVGSGVPKWRLLCPVWPRFLAGLEKPKEINNAGMIHVIGLYSEAEALEAVKCRGAASGFPQNDLAATTIANALGRDPLLIGLYDFAAGDHGIDVIAQYVGNEMERAALSASLTTSDIELAVDALMSKMLETGRLAPTWREIQEWLGEGASLNALRILVTSGRALRLSKSGGTDVIEARHDRVLHFMLASCIANAMRTGNSAPSHADPYFAEFVGTAASIAKFNPQDLRVLMGDSPLIAFYAFKNAVQRDAEYAKAMAQLIDNWVSTTEVRGRTYFSRRAHGLRILAEIDSPTVLPLTAKFPKHDWYQPLFEARFRNGDLSDGLRWITEYPFEVNISGRKELVDHVRQKYRNGLVNAVQKVLVDEKSSDAAKWGALYLSGYIGDPSLASAVRRAWEITEPDKRNLEAFLWAAACVCGDEAATTLGPVCDAWEALPDSKDELGESQRNSLAAYGIAWKFRDHVPYSALPYFVQRAKQSMALSWPITYMLRGVDAPVAVRHQVEYLAERKREAERSGSYVLDHFVKDEWRRRSEERGQEMSAESKKCLLDIALNSDNDIHLRKTAFTLWEVSVSDGDIDIARAVKSGDVLHGTAVWARARRRDLTVIPELLEKLKENPRYWWQTGRYIWTDELSDALRESLRKMSADRDEESEETGEWMFPELLLRLDVETAERLLLAVWPVAQTRPRLIQTALVLATPKLLECATAVISRASDPAKLLEYFSTTAGLRTVGRAGITRFAQMEALRPYLTILKEHDIYQLWHVCNRQGWKNFRVENLDPILLSSNGSRIERLSIHLDISELDSELAGKRTLSYLWFERHLENGVERNSLFDAILGWVDEKESIAALVVAGRIFSSVATRSEYERLKETAESIPDSEQLLAAIKFDVYDRILV